MSFSYARGEISSFVVAVLRPYIRLVKNRDLMRFPDAEELYALERAARVARSREMGKLVRRAFEALRRRFEAKGRMRHA